VSSEPFLSSFLLASPACVVNSELRGLGKKRDTTVRRRGCSQTPCDPCTGQPTACHSARRNHKRRCTLLPSRASGSLPSGVGLEIRTCSEVRSGGPRNEVQERSGGVWKFTHPHRMTPPGARSNPPYPPYPPQPRNSAEFGGGWGGMRNSRFRPEFGLFLMFRGIRRIRPVSAVFLPNPGNTLFCTFFANSRGSRETPRNVEFRPQFRGGTPAPYMFFIRSWTRFARPKKTRCESNF